MKKLAVAAAVLAAVFAVSLAALPGAVAETLLSRAVHAPVEVENARWTGFGSFSAARVIIGAPDAARKILEGVRVHGLWGVWTGAPVRVRIEAVHVAGKQLGRARGGIVWRAGRLVKAHGRVTLSEAGFRYAPKKLLKRLVATPDGPSFIAAYAAGRILLRGRGGPVLEAVWQPG